MCRALPLAVGTTGLEQGRSPPKLPPLARSLLATPLSAVEQLGVTERRSVTRKLCKTAPTAQSRSTRVHASSLRAGSLALSSPLACCAPWPQGEACNTVADFKPVLHTAVSACHDVLLYAALARVVCYRYVGTCHLANGSPTRLQQFDPASTQPDCCRRRATHSHVAPCCTEVGGTPVHACHVLVRWSP